jgi:hypothetical protein
MTKRSTASEQHRQQEPEEEEREIGEVQRELEMHSSGRYGCR